jgi:hypothetical protein
MHAISSIEACVAAESPRPCWKDQGDRSSYLVEAATWGSAVDACTPCACDSRLDESRPLPSTVLMRDSTLLRPFLSLETVDPSGTAALIFREVDGREGRIRIVDG